MSPRIHQVLRGGGLKYFMGEMLRADRASDLYFGGLQVEPAPGSG
jgi:hypothetical protein